MFTSGRGYRLTDCADKWQRKVNADKAWRCTFCPREQNKSGLNGTILSVQKWDPSVQGPCQVTNTPTHEHPYIWILGTGRMSCRLLSDWRSLPPSGNSVHSKNALVYLHFALDCPMLLFKYTVHHPWTVSPRHFPFDSCELVGTAMVSNLWTAWIMNTTVS